MGTLTKLTPCYKALPKQLWAFLSDICLNNLNLLNIYKISCQLYKHSYSSANTILSF